MNQPDDPGVEPGGEAPRPASRPWKLATGVFGLAFAAFLIAATTLWGDPANSLHTSAQSWGFALFFAIAGGVLVDSMAVSFGWIRRD